MRMAKERPKSKMLEEMNKFPEELELGGGIPLSMRLANHYKRQLDPTYVPQIVRPQEVGGAIHLDRLATPMPSQATAYLKHRVQQQIDRLPLVEDAQKVSVVGNGNVVTLSQMTASQRAAEYRRRAAAALAPPAPSQGTTRPHYVECPPKTSSIYVTRVQHESKGA